MNLTLNLILAIKISVFSIVSSDRMNIREQGCGNDRRGLCSIFEDTSIILYYKYLYASFRKKEISDHIYKQYLGERSLKSSCIVCH